MSTPSSARNIAGILGRTALRALVLVVLVAAASMALLVYMTSMPGERYRGKIATRSDNDRAVADRLEAHVRALSATIGPRGDDYPDNYRAAEAYIVAELAEMGFTDIAREPVPSLSGQVWHNIVVELPGTSSPEDVVLLGAHYDTAWSTPGANDNASGVAAALEVARALKQGKHAARRTIRIVFFANEEPPHYKTGTMGSVVYARHALERGDQIALAVIYDMIGYYDDAPGSQRFPPGLSWFYDDTADFVALVGDIDSRDHLRRALTTFRGATRFPAEGLIAPRWFPGVAMSDHASFWAHDVPAIQITDTAFFRYDHYHKLSDTADKLSYGHMAHITQGTVAVLLREAQSEE